MLLLLAAATSPLQRQRAIVANAVGCARGKADEIVVCARDRDERSPYRLPVIESEDGFQIDGSRDSVSRERHRLMDVGGAGSQANACSATGAGGQAGCLVKEWKEKAEQRGFRPD